MFKYLPNVSSTRSQPPTDTWRSNSADPLPFLDISYYDSTAILISSKRIVRHKLPRHTARLVCLSIVMNTTLLLSAHFFTLKVIAIKHQVGGNEKISVFYFI